MFDISKELSTRFKANKINGSCTTNRFYAFKIIAFTPLININSSIFFQLKVQQSLAHTPFWMIILRLM